MKPFTTLAVVLFALMALAHLLRLVWGWEILVNGTTVPQWASLPALIVAGGLAVLLWQESRR